MAIFSPLLLFPPQFPLVRSSHIAGIALHSLDYPVDDSRGDEDEVDTVDDSGGDTVYLVMKMTTMLRVMLMIPVHQA